jgi:hypothetical protein
MTYPDGIDALVNVNATDSLAAGGHAARHNSVNTALVEIKNMLGPSPAGKIMQIVRATDSTNRSTTSGSFVDASISVTITPQKNDSAIILIYSGLAEAARGAIGNSFGSVQITDNSNNAISGAQIIGFGDANSAQHQAPIVAIGYSTPATESATTYKVRFAIAASGVTLNLLNANQTGQLYAIEVSA